MDNPGDGKLWGGRFSKSPAPAAERLSASVHFDRILYKYDIRASLAHVEMLERCGVLSAGETRRIIDGLRRIEAEMDSGYFVFDESLEDIHTNIEKRLIEIIGPVGGKMHTARSRNDQVVTAVMLYMRDACRDIGKLLGDVMRSFVDQAKRHIDTILPGYTHLQVGQPVRLAQHLLAYFQKFSRDYRRLCYVEESLVECPLGSGAMGGVNYPTDRRWTARKLGFADIAPNSMDGVSHRDYILDFHHFASTLFVHLSRFCEELVLWSSQEYSFVRLSDEVTTGSSIMPQKKNPDIAELIRGKTGRIIGNHISLLVVLKGLPLTYNRDLQEDKEALFDSVETVQDALEAFAGMVRTAEFLPENMQKSLASGFALATDLADYLVAKGVPFREAHGIVGRLVLQLERDGKTIETVDTEYMRKIDGRIDEDFAEKVSYPHSVDAKLSEGSTSKESILRQLDQAIQFLKNLVDR